MFKSTTDYDKAMVKILNCILSGDKAFKDVYETYGVLDSGDALAECMARGYIAGLSADHESITQTELSTAPHVRLTYQGLKYLENNSHYKSNDNGSNVRQNP